MRRHQGRSEHKPGALSKRRLDRLSNTVNDLFENATQNEKTLRRYQQFELKLLDLSGFEALLDMLIRNSVDYFQLECAQLWLYDPQSTLSELLPEQYQHIPQLRLLPTASELTALYGSQPTVRLLSVEGKNTLPVFNGLGLRSCALLPLVRHDVIVGSLHFGVKKAQRFSKDKSTDFIAHLASVVSVCLENAVNQDRLHRLSMYDMLTQVKNRRAFHLALDNEVSRAARSGDPLSLLFVDFDYFKRINDQYGHPMGDRVLKHIAQFMNTLLRKTDHVCRYGGEEFALVLPNCGRGRALEIAERIRLQVSELTTTDDNGVSVTVTLSIGVSGWYDIDNVGEVANETEKHIATELIASADKGVYFAKAAGRNRCHYVALTLSEIQQRLMSDCSIQHTVPATDIKLNHNHNHNHNNTSAVEGKNLESRCNDVWPEMTL